MNWFVQSQRGDNASGWEGRMALIWMPPPPAVYEPVIIETGQVEIYADGAIHRPGEHIMECLCYRAYVVDGVVELREVARVLFPLAGFDRSLASAHAMRLGGSRH
jgi:hypothetical protein